MTPFKFSQQVAPTRNYNAVCHSVSLSVCQSVSLSVCQPVSLSVCQYVSLSACQSVSLSVCQSVSLSVCQFVGLPLCYSVIYMYNADYKRVPLPKHGTAFFGGTILVPRLWFELVPRLVRVAIISHDITDSRQTCQNIAFHKCTQSVPLLSTDSMYKLQA